jgi:hypothetical protein
MRPLLPLLLASLACVSAFGQAPSPSPSGSPFVARPSADFTPLTPDEGKTLNAASEKAKNDPKVIAAAKKLHTAMLDARAVMIAQNPKIAALLERAMPSGSPSFGSPRPAMTAEDFPKIRAARDAIKDTPQGLAWQKATAEYRTAVHDAMIAADPKVAAIFAKLPPVGIPGAGKNSSPSPAASPH